MKRLITIILTTIICISIYPQKEIYFSNINPDSIKVESFKGLETNFFFEPLSLLGSSTNLGLKTFSYPLYIGFFNEKAMAQNWSLTTRIGLLNYINGISDYNIIYDSITGNKLYSFDYSKYLIMYRLQLSIGIEPRYYFNYKDRILAGKSKLNSGLFISCPLSLSVPLLQTPISKLNYGWYPSSFNIHGIIIPEFGYRKALSDKWFIEGSLGLSLTADYIFYSTSPYFTRVKAATELKIKAAYILK